jgi:hypothetical protein
LIGIGGPNARWPGHAADLPTNIEVKRIVPPAKGQVQKFRQRMPEMVNLAWWGSAILVWG